MDGTAGNVLTNYRVHLASFSGDRTGAAVKLFERHAASWGKTLVFFTRKDIAKHFARSVRTAVVETIDCDVPKRERASIVHRLENDNISAITYINCWKEVVIPTVQTVLIACDHCESEMRGIARLASYAHESKQHYSVAVLAPEADFPARRDELLAIFRHSVGQADTSSARSAGRVHGPGRERLEIGDGEVIEEHVYDSEGRLLSTRDYSELRRLWELWHKFSFDTRQQWNIKGVIDRAERGVDRSFNLQKEVERYQTEYERIQKLAQK